MMTVYVVEYESFVLMDKHVDKVFRNEEDANSYCYKMNASDMSDYHWDYRTMELE